MRVGISSEERDAKAAGGTITSKRYLLLPTQNGDFWGAVQEKTEKPITTDRIQELVRRMKAFC
jgi:hypothetical protein